MMTTKKRSRFHLGLVVIAASAALLTACGPPGGRELRKGELDIQAGHYNEAVSELEEALRVMNDSVPAGSQAKAWNLLGLGYAGLGKMEAAGKAYLKAQRLDRKNAAVDFNLGCLRAQQGDLRAAEEYFTTYIMLRPHDAEGFLRRGLVFLHGSSGRPVAERNRLLDAARKDLEAADKMDGTPESANALGMYYMLRRPTGVDFGLAAATNFGAALKRDTNYHAALLNLAVVSQTQLNNQPQALRLYRDYLAACPSAPNAKQIAAVAKDIDLSLKISITPVGGKVANTPARTETVPVRAAVAPPAGQVPTPAPNSAPPQTQQSSPPPKQTVSSPPQNLPPPAAVHVDASAAPVREEPSSAAPVPPPSYQTVLVQPSPQMPAQAQPLTQSQPTPQTSQPAPPPQLTNTAQVAKVPDAAANYVAIPDTIPQPVVSDTGRAAHKTLTQRLNPMGWFSGKSKADDAVPLQSPGEPPPVPLGTHFDYPPQTTPVPGNRAQARKLIAEAIRARQAGDAQQSAQAFRDAAAADPSSYDASYGLGLALVDTHDYKAALNELCRAANLTSNASDARYAFAWVLQKRGYYEDAVHELGKMVADNPNDVRSHLLLGNLYSDRLNEPKLAREQYLDALQLDPKNAQAANIRAWLDHN